MQGCNKVTPDTFLLQAEQLQTTQPIATAEMLQPSDHLHGLLWTYSNRSKSFLCWGLKSWVQPSRWDLIWAGQGGRIPSLPAVYATGMGPGCVGGFWVPAHMARACPASLPAACPSPSQQGYSRPFIPSLDGYRGSPDPGTAPCTCPCWDLLFSPSCDSFCSPNFTLFIFPIQIPEYGANAGFLGKCWFH